MYDDGGLYQYTRYKVILENDEVRYFANDEIFDRDSEVDLRSFLL